MRGVSDSPLVPFLRAAAAQGCRPEAQPAVAAWARRSGEVAAWLCLAGAEELDSSVRPQVAERPEAAVRAAYLARADTAADEAEALGSTERRGEVLAGLAANPNVGEAVLVRLAGLNKIPVALALLERTRLPGPALVAAERLCRCPTEAVEAAPGLHSVLARQVCSPRVAVWSLACSEHLDAEAEARLVALCVTTPLAQATDPRMALDDHDANAAHSVLSAIGVLAGRTSLTGEGRAALARAVETIQATWPAWSSHTAELAERLGAGGDDTAADRLARAGSVGGCELEELVGLAAASYDAELACALSTNPALGAAQAARIVARWTPSACLAVVRARPGWVPGLVFALEACGLARVAVAAGMGGARVVEAVASLAGQDPDTYEAVDAHEALSELARRGELATEEVIALPLELAGQWAQSQTSARVAEVLSVLVARSAAAGVTEAALGLSEEFEGSLGQLFELAELAELATRDGRGG